MATCWVSHTAHPTSMFSIHGRSTPAACCSPNMSKVCVTRKLSHWLPAYLCMRQETAQQVPNVCACPCPCMPPEPSVHGSPRAPRVSSRAPLRAETQKNFCAARICFNSLSSSLVAVPGTTYMSWYSGFFSVHRLRIACVAAAVHDGAARQDSAAGQEAALPGAGCQHAPPHPAAPAPLPVPRALRTPQCVNRGATARCERYRPCRSTGARFSYS